MEFFETVKLLLFDYTTRTISIGTVIIGAVSGILGTYAVLRKQSLLGDAISHAALPGIAIVFLLTGVKNPLLFLLGAIISGLVGTLWILSITNNTRIKNDTALGLVLSVFFGFGMVLLTYIQKLPNADQSGLSTYLFGQAATLMAKDVIAMAIIGGIALIMIFVFWKEFKLLAFDAQYAKTLGFNIKALDIMLTAAIVLAIVLGLQTVGVVLMSALILAPAAAARQWTNRLSILVGLSALFGALSGFIGTAISSTGEKIATGPTIVLVAALLVATSFVFAPNRGLLFKHIRLLRNRKTLRLNKTLSLMYEIASSHENYSHPHSINILNETKGFHKKCIVELQHQGLIQLLPNKEWSLTKDGYHEAKNLYQTQQTMNND